VVFSSKQDGGVDLPALQQARSILSFLRKVYNISMSWKRPTLVDQTPRFDSLLDQIIVYRPEDSQAKGDRSILHFDQQKYSRVLPLTYPQANNLPPVLFH
jgi:hypothetical protein